MPELPEVETIRTQLEAILPFEIERASYSPVVSSILKEEDRSFDPTGHTLVDFWRWGKMLVMELDDGNKIVSHLGMSGSWRLSEEPLVGVKHVHVVFEGKGAGPVRFLSYVDPRRFGRMAYVTPEEFALYRERLGVDIASDEFDAEYIYRTLKAHPQKQLKPFLLDQKYFAGCGNYIACEICARAGIRPTRRCGKVSKKEAQKIKDATVSVLEGSLQTKGLTFSGGYSDTTGNRGEGVQNLVVFYQKICGLCEKTPVKKIVLAQRGTYYCPHCQK